MKRLLSWFMTLCLMLTVFAVTAAAVDDSRSYLFDLSADGNHNAVVNTGDVITVSLVLERTDAEEGYTMYGMQDEIKYDPEYFELVDNSLLIGNGVQTSEISLLDGYKEFYMNFVSMSGGEEWGARTTVGSFQLKVIAQTGSTKITSENCEVSLQDGSDSYAVETQNVNVAIEGYETAAMKDASGADVSSVGWGLWWLPVLLVVLLLLALLLLSLLRKTVRFSCGGGRELKPVKVWKGKKIPRPETPRRNDAVFGGWFADSGRTRKWNFMTDVVTQNLTLYALWQTDVMQSNGTREKEAMPLD